MIREPLNAWPTSASPELSPPGSVRPQFCYDLWDVASWTAFQDDPEMKSVRALAAASLGAAGLFLAACPGRPPGLSDLAEALDGLRLVEPRLTGGFSHAPCGPRSENRLSMPHCSDPPLPGTPKHRTLAKLVTGFENMARRERSAASFQIYGVALLLVAPDDRDRAVVVLEKASALAPSDARVLNDLAAAYYVRAQQTGRPEDLVRALARVRRAVEEEGSFPEARFNEALVLEALNLRSEAKKVWQEFLRLDRGTAWGEEARRSSLALHKGDATSSWDAALKELDAAVQRNDRIGIQSIVVRFPQAARLHIEERLLSDWAGAVLEDRPTDAEALLQKARTIATELERYGGDRLLSEAVAELETAALSRRDRLAVLVEGHSSYAKGLELYRRFEIGPAAERFEAARRAFLRGGSAFRGWAEFYLAVCAYQRYDYPLALDILGQLRDRASEEGYPILGGRALWVMGLCLIDAARPVEALDTYREALASLSRARETESVVSVHALLADALRYLGEDREAWRHRYQALRGLTGLREARRRHAIVGEAGLAALRLGEPQAAISFQNEAVQLGESSGQAIDLSEALRSRATIHLRVGNPEAALADLKKAGQRVAELGDERVRQIVSGRIREVEARLHQKSNPEKSIQLLTEAEELFRTVGYRFPLAGIYVERAEAGFATGQSEDARADLRAAVQQIEAESDEALRALRKGEGRTLWGELSLREAYFEKGKDPFDQVLLHSAAAGEVRGAWELAEREQAREFLFSLLSLPVRSVSLGVPASMVQALPSAEIERRIPDGTALLQYELLEDRLLVWLIRNDRLRMWIERPGRAVLQSRIAQTRAALSGSGEKARAQGKEGLQRLFRDLVEPTLSDLVGIETLVFIPDEALQDVPFAALVSPATGHYLVEDRQVVVAPSATLYVESLRRDRELAAHPNFSALAVGDPAYDRGLFPTLPPLRHAKAEAARIAGSYPGSDLLEGPAATKTRFLALAGRHGIVHAAAHAVSREDSPLVSTLVLAADGRESGTLYAHELLGLRFERTRLVVLSACSSAGRRRGGGRAGFVLPLLGAGVPSVVASLWPVDDRATARLFAVFHERYRAGDSAPAALRAAQLSLLQNNDPDLRAPAMWAGFEVFGGTASTRQTKERSQR